MKRCSSFFFFFKQKTAYEIGTGDWSSDVCSSDLNFEPASLICDDSDQEAYQSSVNQMVDIIKEGHLDRKSVV